MESVRETQVDEIALALPQRVSTLLRLLRARTDADLSRTEAGVLHVLSQCPTRVTDLARQEGVTQPAITLVVNRLERQGWVTREADPRDGRVVLVAITPAGREALERLRVQYRALLHEEMATLDDEDVDALARSIEVVDDLIERLKGAPVSRRPA